MTRPGRWLCCAAALSTAAGALAGWRPMLLGVLSAAAVLTWGLLAVDRLNYVLLAVLVFVPVTVNPGYPISPVWMVLLAGTAIALLGRLARLDPHAPVASIGLVAFVLPVTCVFAAMVRWSGLRDLVIGVLPFGCYAMIAWHLVDEGRRAPATFVRLARTLAWAGLPVAALAIYQRATGSWPILDDFATSNAYTSTAAAGRSAGTMGHPIIYGTYCMVAVCIAVTLRGRLWQVPFAAGAVGLLLSGSRSAWIGTAAALVVWYFAQPRKVTKRGIQLVMSGAVVAVVLLVTSPPPVRDLIDMVRGRLSNVTGSSSAAARFERSAQAWSGVSDSLVGLLFGQGPEAHVRFFQQIGVADGLAQTFDNSYLTLWYDFGALTLLAFAAVLVATLVRGSSLTARILIVGFAIQIWFFDFYLWPSAAAALLLAVALEPATSSAARQTYHAGTSPEPVLAAPSR